MTPQQLASARQELEKLPLLGPALWLFARDPTRRFTFVADLDWRLLPPLVLDQCKLYSREGIPWAFVTWARVSDAIDGRLRSAPVIAPHEWRPGDELWLIDIVAPFGDAPGMARQALHDMGGTDTSASAWLQGVDGRSELTEIRRDG